MTPNLLTWYFLSMFVYITKLRRLPIGHILSPVLRAIDLPLHCTLGLAWVTIATLRLPKPGITRNQP
jgi:hypothetical protein